MKSYQSELVVVMNCGDLIDKVKDHTIRNNDAVLTSFELLNESENRDDFQAIFNDLEFYKPRFEGFILLHR